jgi:hypothetical protein
MKYNILIACIFFFFFLNSCTKEESKKVICTITSPTDNAVFTEDQSITVKVEATPAKGKITSVQLFVDDSPSQFIVSPPYTFTIHQGVISVGRHTLKVNAQDEKGGVCTT